MTSASTGRLPVFGTVLLTYAMLTAYWARGLRQYFGVVLVILALGGAAHWYVGEPGLADGGATSIDGIWRLEIIVLAMLIPETILFVGLFRLAINERIDRNNFFGLRWGRWETCVLLRGLLLGLILGALAAVVVLPVMFTFVSIMGTNNAPASNYVQYGTIIGFLLILPIIYFLGRFLLYPCSPALDEKLRLGQSWTLTRNNGLRILATMILVQLPVIVVNLVLNYAAGLQGTLVGAVLSGIVAIIGIMLWAFESAIFYRTFVDRSAIAAEANAAVT